MKTTPHLLVAGVLIVITLFAAVPSLFAGFGGMKHDFRELRIVGSATRTDVVPADRATAPLVADLARPPSSNPFSARKDARLGLDMIKIDAPPPPRLDYPPLPVLPVPVK
jgi:hypothetical protein